MREGWYKCENSAVVSSASEGGLVQRISQSDQTESYLIVLTFKTGGRLTGGQVDGRH